MSAALFISDPGQGVFSFTGSGSGLSSILYLEGTQYLAASDSEGGTTVRPVTIAVDPQGRINGASTGPALALSAGHDHEGIAFNPKRGTLFVSDEGNPPEGSAIREFNRLTGSLVGTVATPGVFDQNRANMGLESLSYGAGYLWTVNEQALQHESRTSNTDHGTLVRLQRFDEDLLPAGQWAYLTDNNGAVSELLALPDGELLTLERGQVGGRYQIRIYLVDFAGATSTSGLADLDAGGFITVSKSLLWEADWGTGLGHNFEGLALGPAIGIDSNSLILIADNGTGSQQRLYGLALHGLVPEPTSAGSVAAGGFVLLLRRRPLGK